MLVSNLWLRACGPRNMQGIRRVWVCVWVRVCARTCMFAYTYLSVCVCAQTCISVHVYVCMRAFVCGVCVKLIFIGFA